MTEQHNDLGQPVGTALPRWTARALPSAAAMTGQYCKIEKLDAARHAGDLFATYAEAPSGRDWTYMFSGPFESETSYADYARTLAGSRDPLHYAILDESGKPCGTAALMRVDPANGSIEVGHIAYAPRLQRRRAGTEAMFLLMRHAFDELGYRRYEWNATA